MDKKEKITILYIDDEANNLFSFKALLRIDYKVYTAQSADIAYDILRSDPDIHLIISDQNMPHETGVEFFERVCKDFPLPVRMLLTGYADMTAVIDSINRGRIFRYITKPWNEYELISAIQEAYQYYESNSLLKIRNEQLQQAYEELDRFSYSVTHDIRGPIVSTLSALDVLQDVNDLGEIRRFLGLLEKSMRRLNTFIMDTHNYHRVSRGELELSPIDFSALASNIREVYDVEEKVHGTQFNITVDQQGEFISDEILLLLIINNLLSNAFKYARTDTARHAVSLNISVQQNRAVIRIEDNGIGIAPEQINRIFELFYRSKDVRMSMGSGFGMYNVNLAISKLGGKINVDSTPQVGSIFEVVLDSKQAI